MNQNGDQPFDNLNDLVRDTKSGDTHARDQLINQVQSYVNLIASRFEDANVKQKFGHSDIVQSSMVEIVKGLPGFRGTTGGEFKVWVRTILENQIKRCHRDLQRDKRNVNRERSQYDSQDNAIVLKDIQPTPQTDAIRRERRNRLYNAILQLPTDYARVIQLRSLERMPFKEVATTMDRTEDSVTKLWYRAVSKLSLMLKEGHESIS